MSDVAPPISFTFTKNDEERIPSASLEKCMVELLHNPTELRGGLRNKRRQPPLFRIQVLTAQNYSMTDQLSCLGVRGLELDLHYSELFCTSSVTGL